MIEAILPPGVKWSELFDDPPDADLFPDEEAAVAKAVDKRRREFATGRLCARAALAELGLPPAPILRGERGAPQWPPGVVGSITHCDGYRAAVAGLSTRFATVGVDAEPDQPVSGGSLGIVATPGEQEHVRELARTWPGGPSWDRLLFCVKEAVYKAWFPLTGRWLGFEQAEVHIDPGAATFAARLLVPGPVMDGREVTGFAGRWLARDGLILAAIAVPAGGS